MMLTLFRLRLINASIMTVPPQTRECRPFFRYGLGTGRAQELYSYICRPVSLEGVIKASITVAVKSRTD